MKHYLRGEEGTYYEDLWPLVKYLPAYALPTGLPSPGPDVEEKQDENNIDPDMTRNSTVSPRSTSALHLPLHNSSRVKARPPNIIVPPSPAVGPNGRPTRMSLAPPEVSRPSNRLFEEQGLLPSRMPPQFSYFDVFPFSLLVKLLTHRGKEVKGRKAARLRAKMGPGKRGRIVTHNVPLEITLYLVGDREAQVVRVFGY